jgi:hypothetical protein
MEIGLVKTRGDPDARFRFFFGSGVAPLPHQDNSQVIGAHRHDPGARRRSFPEMFGAKACGFFRCQIAHSCGRCDVNANFLPSAKSPCQSNQQTLGKVRSSAKEAFCSERNSNRSTLAGRPQKRRRTGHAGGAGPEEFPTISSAGISYCLPWGFSEQQSSCKTSAAICPSKSR